MWLPPQVDRKYEHEAAEFRREILDRAVRGEMLKVKGILDEFNYELRRIDPKLEMVRLDGNCDTGGTPMKAGYYHVVRWNDGAPPSVIVVEGEHGEFVEPTSRVFEMLAKNDLWDPANMRLLRQRERLAEQAAEKRKVAEREERQQEIFERFQAGTRTFVSMDRSTPWSQNASANGRRDAGERRARR